MKAETLKAQSGLLGVSDELAKKIRQSAQISWQNLGKKITFYLPGMFNLYGLTGKYPAISVTGHHCDLNCKHCKGKLLRSMVPCASPKKLLELASKWREEGIEGVLLSGGSTLDGYVPLQRVLPAVPILKEMGFYVSAHSGFATPELAKMLKQYGVDQVLVDVVGDDWAVRNILNLPGIKVVHRALEALYSEGLNVAPHIIIGLSGKIAGEYKALKMLVKYPVSILIFVVLMPAVAMSNIVLPVPLEDALSVIVEGRQMFPDIPHSLGCARPRGIYRRTLEKWALRAGINRIALFSEEAVEEAESLGLEIKYELTCCSVMKK